MGYHFVERGGHPGDGRVVRLRLSESGERLIRELFPVFNQEEAFVVETLKADDARSLRDVVLHLEEHGDGRRAAMRRAMPAARRSGGRSQRLSRLLPPTG